MEETIKNWQQDPEFKGLDLTSKARVYLNYFDTELADDEFRGLPKETQRQVKTNFLHEQDVDLGAVDRIKDPKTLAKSTAKATRLKYTGEEWITGKVPSLVREEYAPIKGMFTLGLATTRLPQELTSSVLSAIRGGKIKVDKGWSAEFMEKTKESAEAFTKKYGTKQQIAPGITVEDVTRLPQNLGFTLTSALVGLGVGLPLSAIPGIGIPTAAFTGTAAVSVTAYRMAKDQFTNDIFEMVNQASIRNRGSKLTQNEWNLISERYENKAIKYGLWEAIPEALGQAAILGILKLPIGKFLKVPAVKNRLARTLASAAAKFAGIQAEEQFTETITQYGQAGLEAEAGLREKPTTFTEAFWEQYPATALLAGVTAGGGAVAVKSYEKLRRVIPKEKPTVIEPTEVTPPEEAPPTVTRDEAVKQDFLANIAEYVKSGEIGPAEVAFMGKSAQVQALGITQEELNAVAGKVVGDTVATSVKEDIATSHQKAFDKFLDEVEEVEPIEVEEPTEWLPTAEEIEFLTEARDVESLEVQHQAISDILKKHGVHKPTQLQVETVYKSISDIIGKKPEIKKEVEVPKAEEKVEEIPTVKEIDKAAKEAETEPTEAQKEAGNYKLGHINLYGFDISIENPKGSTRSGVDPTGKEWSIELKHHYGYIKETKGKDKDHLDAFIGPKPESDKVFVVDQTVPDTGKFDEHKIMMGFETEEEARAGYLANYESGWKGLGDITELTVDEFKEWTKGDTTKAIRKAAKPEVEPSASFLGWQETAEGDHVALYNIESGPKEGTTVTVGGLEREDIEVPETPEKPAKKPPMEPPPKKPPVKEKPKAPPKPTPEPKAKEAWEKTLKKYVEDYGGDWEKVKARLDTGEKVEYGVLTGLEGDRTRHAVKYHWQEVDKAIKEGKITSHPDYPELGKVEAEYYLTDKGSIITEPLTVEQRKKQFKGFATFDEAEKARKEWLKVKKIEVKKAKEKPTPPEPKVEEKPPHYDYLNVLLTEVKQGEPGRRIRTVDAEGRETWTGQKTTYPEFMRGKNWTGKDVARAIELELAGEKLGSRQQIMIEAALYEGEARYERDKKELDNLRELRDNALKEEKDRGISEREVQGSLEREITQEIAAEKEFDETPTNQIEAEYNNLTQETFLEEAPFELRPTEAPPKVVGPLGKKAVIPTEKVPIATKGEQVSLLPKKKGEQISLEEAIEEKETRLAMESALKAEPEGYKFTKRQQKDLIKIGQLIPQWLQKAGADWEILQNITIELKPFIDLKGKNVDKTLKDWEKEGVDAGKVVGATSLGRYHAVIQLAINGQKLAELERSTYHEWYHIAKAWMLPQSDISALAKHFKTEESEADAFAEYMKNAKSIQDKPGLIKRLFLKLKRMITIIRNGLNAKGFTRAEDIFGSIRVRAYKPVRVAKPITAVGLEAETRLAMEKKPPISKEEKTAEEYIQKALGKVKETKVVELKPTEEITGAAYDKIVEQEAQKPIERLIEEALHDERLIHHVRSTLKKAMTIGKKEGIAKQKSHYRAVVARAKARKEQIAKIRKMVDALKKIDTEKMSPQEAEPVRALLTGLNLVKPTKKTIIKLTRTREYLEKDHDAELPEYVMESLKRLDKRNIRDMNVDEIEAIHTGVMHYVHLNKLKNTIKVRREARRKAEVLASSIGEMKEPKAVKSDIVSSQKAKMGRTKKTATLIKDTFGIRHDHYDLIIESLSGQNSTMDKVLYQDIKDGITEQLKYKQDTYAQFLKDLGADFSEKYEIKDIGNWLNEQVVTGSFELTRAERMALLRHTLNIDNLRHLLAGGFGFRTSETPNRVYKISAKQLNGVLKNLTPAEKHFAIEPVNKLFEEQYKRLNKVFYQKNGYLLPKTKDPYYPIEVMPITLGTDLETVDALEKLKGVWTRIGLEKGMLEKRVKSRKPIYLNSIAFDINRSVMKSSAYIGLEIPLSNASKLLYDQTFRAHLEDRYGKQTWREIEKGLRDIAGDYQSYTTVEEMVLKLKNNLSVAMLGINPFVMTKQVLSLPVYLPYVKLEYMLQGMLDFAVHPIEVSERHKMYSPEYLERVEGGYSRDVADVFKGAAMKRLYAGRTTVKEKFMGGIQLFDRTAVSAGMQGAVLQVLDEFDQGKLSREVRIALDMKDAEIAKLTSAQKMKLAYKFADYATERTQPMFSPEHRSSLSRGATIEKMATMFGAFTNQALNLMRRTYREARRTGEPAAYAKLGKALFLILVVNSLGVMSIDEIRNRLYRKKERPSIAGRILNTWAGYMFFVRDLANSVISKIEKGTFLGYDVQLPVQRIPELLSNVLANGVKMMAEKTQAKRKKAAIRFVDDSLNLLLTMQGWPYQTPKKMIISAVKPKESRAVHY